MDDGKLCSPSETDPLMPHKAYHRPQFLIFTVAIALCLTICTVLFVSVFPLSRCNIPLDPDVQDRIRKEWDIELRKHEEAVERRRREEEERLRLNMFWDDAKSGTTCTTYGTREYTARLMNVPSY